MIDGAANITNAISNVVLDRHCQNVNDTNSFTVYIASSCIQTLRTVVAILLLLFCCWLNRNPDFFGF